MRIGIAVDHGRFGLTRQLTAARTVVNYEVADFGAHGML
jgi:ribose 5-phosphate isomerase RpiB